MKEQTKEQFRHTGRWPVWHALVCQCKVMNVEMSDDD